MEGTQEGKVRLIEIKERILADNRKLAERLRSRLAASKTFLLCV